MQRAALLGLLGLNAWGWACSPAEPPARVAQASEALRQLAPRSVPCPQPQPARHWTSCDLYRVPPARLVPLLKTAHNAKAVSDGKGWRLTTSDGSGTSLVVRAQGGGTLVNLRVQEWADDKLRGELWQALDERLEDWKKRHWWAFFRQPTCADLGIHDTDWYKLESCRLAGRPQRDGSSLNGLPVIEIAVRWAVDKSIPLHQVRRFGYTANSCSMYEFLEETP